MRKFQNCDILGKFYACNAEDFERRDFACKLKFLREGLGCDMQDNYDYLWNLCSVYDNNHRGANLTRKITYKDNFGEYIKVDINELIEQIYVSPYAPSFMIDTIKLLIKQLGYDFPVINSLLYTINR